MESNKKMKMTSLKTLTDLPETIIHDILCLIPFKEAVRTSVLSRSWRRRWRSIPDLDLSDINNMVASQIVLLHSSPLRLLKADVNSDAFTFLSGQSGPTLRTLRLFYSHGRLDSIDSIARSFPNLTHLQLKVSFYFGFVSRDFSGFKTLQTIHLEHVYFFSFVVSVLFSSCPLLEAAALVDIYSPESQQIDIYAPNLRSLKLKHAVQVKLAITIDGDFSGLKNLRILHLEFITFAAQLSKLFSACHFLEEVNLINIRLQETQHLDIIAPNLRLLKLVNLGDFWDPEHLGDGNFSGLKNLRILHLESITFAFHLSKLFSACHFLEEVNLTRISLQETQHLDIDIIAPNLRLLKIMNVGGFIGGKHLLVITIDEDTPGLKNLRILHLEFITFAAQISKLFSACHFLEEVNLTRVRLQETQHLDIIAPNLRLLKLANVGSFRDNKQLVIITGNGDFFSGLKNLRTLHLEYVSFGAHAHLSKLFSACTLLVEVTICGLHLGDKGQSLDIAAPNLRRLELERMDYDDCLDDFTISSAPVLEVVLLDPRLSNCYWVGPKGDCKLMGMPNLKKLELWIRDYIEHPHKAHIPRRLPISFDHLKIMILNVRFEVESEALLTLCLLRSSPNLQEFEYLADYYSTEVAGLGPDFWEAQEHVGVFDKLQTVKITWISCVKAELEFIQFVLAKAQSLKTMIVSFEDALVTVKEVAMPEILEFPMISKEGQILFA